LLLLRRLVLRPRDAAQPQTDRKDRAQQFHVLS
jgi:hypothetical protein